MNKLSVALLVLFLCTLTLQQPSPPVWNPSWSSNFTESSWFPEFGNNTFKGYYLYDYANNRSKIWRSNGRTDRYCGTIHPGVIMECTQLMINKKRYIIFPAIKQCCMCCTDAQGCGTVIPTWMASATLYSTASSGQDTVYTWLEKGGQENFYAETVTKAGQRIPTKIYMEPNDDINFQVSTYNGSPTYTANDFALPTTYGDCETHCPKNSVCGLIPPETAQE